MKTMLLTALLALFAGTASATNYYLAANGDDSRTAAQASNPATPWKTIAKINAVFSTIRPGDSVLFRRGDVFTGCLLPNVNGAATAPIVIGAYGTGAKPVLSGFTTLTGWINKGNGIWETTNALLGTRINMMTVNGFARGIARYPNYDQPNKGYLTIDASASNTITDSALTSTINWTGAEVVIRTSQWTLDKATVTSHTGNTFSFTGLGTITPKVKYGYFFQNHISALDQVGEWTYDPATKKVNMFFGASAPSNFTVRASSEQDVIKVFDRNYIHLTDIIVEGGNENGIDIYSADYIKVANCEVRNNGINGIYASIAESLIVEKNHIHNTNSVGIQMPGSIYNTHIRNNIVRVSGMIPGMGQNGSNTDVGMRINATNTVIEYNHIDSSSYAGIRFTGNHVEIRNNLITRFTLLKDDAGGIYTGSTNANLSYGRKILNNIIIDGTGAREGTMYNVSSFGSGIYLDNNTTGVEIRGNTVARCSKYGIYLHNNQHITVESNTAFANKGAQIMISHDDGKFLPMRNIAFRNNILFSSERDQFAGQFNSVLEDINEFGQIDSNYYIRPKDEGQTIQSITGLYTTTQFIRRHTFQQWKASFVHDANSKNSPYLFDPNANSDTLYLFEYNATTQPRTISLNGQYADAKGTVYSGSITLQPYTAVALMRVSASITYPEISLTAPETNTSFDAPASIRITARATDKEGIAYVEFYRGSTLLNRDSTAPYEFTWNNAGVGTYSITARALDVKGYMTTTPANTITVVNSNPIVSLTSPVGGTVFSIPAAVQLAATATDADGVARVEFYSGSTLLGTDTSAPYSFTWNISTIGTYRLTARALDVKGFATTSASVSVSVINSNPTVSLTTPVNNSSVDAPALLTLAANATDADGVARVEFYQNGILLGTDSAAPYQFTTTNLQPGTYQFTARAVDIRGFSATSAAVNVTVVNSNPIISLNSPGNNASFDAPASLRLAASANDVDGIARVDFFSNGNLIFSDAAAPYEFLWSNVSVGSYTITARAFDTKGNNTQSNLAQVTVINSTPEVSLTAPVANGSFDAPAVVRVAAHAVDADGIRRVEFYGGATLLATDSIAPYEFNWSNLQPGTYSVHARAIDVKGYVATTGAVSFQVVNSNPEISLVTPTANAVYDAPASITISAHAVDADGVARVEFYQGTTLLGTDDAAPYSFTRSGLTPGNYSFSAKAVDIKGYASVTEVVTVSVINSNPEISLLNPAVNSIFDAPAAITISASAVDADGIQRVEFYNGTTLLAMDSVAPYFFTWNGVEPGTYAISAKAVDVKGFTTATAANEITVVNSTPEVSLTSPLYGTSLDAPASINIAAQASDNNGVAKVEFFSGTQLLGADSTAPYTFQWNNVAAGTYTISAKVTDLKGYMATSGTVSVQVVNPAPVVSAVPLVNAAPVVSLTSPVANSTFTAPAVVNISANATDGDGIARVEFFRGTTLIAVDSIAPYAFTWNNVAAGSYSITAKATDTKGAIATSAAVNITVASDRPVVTITSPVVNALYNAPATITLSAVASDADGISRVEFYQGSTLLVNERHAPYSWSWTNVAAGTYVITAKAFDTKGNVTTSAAVTITVQATLNTDPGTPTSGKNQGPEVTLTSPVTNSVYTAPASFRLTATATDKDGIDRVEFYRDGVLIDTERLLPYSWNYTNIPAGTYVFTAKAFDKRGNATVSAPAVVTVNAPATTTGVSSLAAQLGRFQEMQASALVYPNPASSKVQVQWSQNLSSRNGQLSIIALDGRVVVRQQVNLSGNQLTVDVSALSAGHYTLQLSASQLQVSLPFIKQ